MFRPRIGFKKTFVYPLGEAVAKPNTNRSYEVKFYTMKWLNFTPRAFFAHSRSPTSHVGSSFAIWNLTFQCPWAFLHARVPMCDVTSCFTIRNLSFQCLMCFVAQTRACQPSLMPKDPHDQKPRTRMSYSYLHGKLNPKAGEFGWPGVGCHCAVLHVKYMPALHVQQCAFSCAVYPLGEAVAKPNTNRSRSLTLLFSRWAANLLEMSEMAVRPLSAKPWLGNVCALRAQCRPSASGVFFLTYQWGGVGWRAELLCQAHELQTMTHENLKPQTLNPKP